MSLLFRRSKAIESQIDELLDATSQGGMVFEKGIEHYLKSDEELFQQRLHTLRELDKRTLEMRRRIESDLYSHSLMPEHRGDVVQLLDQVYHLLNGVKKTLKQFDVERPEIPQHLDEDFMQLTRASVEASEELVRAVRVFFRDVHAVKDCLHKVRFLETEADRTSLTAGAATGNVDIDVELVDHVNGLQGLPDHHARSFATEVLFDGAVIDGDRAAAGFQINPCRGALATTGTVILFCCHDLTC